VPEKPEIVPEEKVALAVRDQVLCDLLRRLVEELRHSLDSEVYVYKHGERVRRLEPVESHLEPSQTDSVTSVLHPGETRVHFRKTGDAERYLFFADAVFERDPRSPTFSGFTVRGDVRTVGEAAIARFNTWSVTREDRTWSKWL
jgi:hypothetical protein